jgi:hypothetical protein
MAKNGDNFVTQQQYEASMRRHGTADWTREDDRIQSEWLAQQNQPEPPVSGPETDDQPAEDVYPAAGTAADVTAWVVRATGEEGDTEADRAAAALTAEQDRGDKARVGLTRDLEKAAAQP